MEQKSVKEIECLLNTNPGEQILDLLRSDARKGVQRLLKQYERALKEQEKLMKKFDVMTVHERELWAKGYQYIAGIDEVGRGPLAGPVVTAAVILPRNTKLYGLDDSKKLTEKKREELFRLIEEEALAIGVGVASPSKIDELNIYQATKWAMVQAVEHLSMNPDHLLIDAMELPLTIPSRSIVKGDSSSISIAAASIVAKVTRDRMMKQLGREYPQYGFERHMGYPTKEHIEAIERCGIIEAHRKSFAPVKAKLTHKG